MISLQCQQLREQLGDRLIPEFSFEFSFTISSRLMETVKGKVSLSLEAVLPLLGLQDTQHGFSYPGLPPRVPLEGDKADAGPLELENVLIREG